MAPVTVISVREVWYSVLLLSGKAYKDLRERCHLGYLLVNGEDNVTAYVTEREYLNVNCVELAQSVARRLAVCAYVN
jgi:hypothetical protein